MIWKNYIKGVTGGKGTGYLVVCEDLILKRGNKENQIPFDHFRALLWKPLGEVGSQAK